MLKKGQTAMEYVIIIGFSILLVASIAYFIKSRALA
jgi:uncharacterized protein (UPF0333 family)